MARIKESVFKGEFALGVFLDIRSAFDLISHGAILGALFGVGVEGGVLNLISSLLCQWEVEVKRNGTNCCRVLNDGTPQGGVLSPLLWNLVKGQLLQSMNQQPVHAQAYVDDIVLLA